MMAGDYLKPLPRPAPESEPFWAAAREHVLRLQKCAACGQFWFPPSRRCPHCLAAEHSWEEVSGAGRVFSFVVYHRLYDKGWEGELPYVVAVIELLEGPRLLSTLTGIAPKDVVCDMAVKVVFDDVTEDVSLPKFAPA
ncbi:MAG: OB-fold domain-containing protein [Proteobacteria bacterium]|nr:OB-fold domain-containing protein [Pseudomonadota bacterium]